MKDLKVTLVQTPLFWEDPEKNLAMFDSKLSSIEGETDLIVLPEMFSTGFTMNSENVAEEMSGSAVTWMRTAAQSVSSSIAGSIVIREEGRHYNRLVYTGKNGTTRYYDKRHLFRMADEHLHYAAGQEKKIVDEQGWNINLQVCYDLRFPVWSRNRYTKTGDKAEAAYDVMIYVANWPEVRVNAWDCLLRARAIENQCYIIGVNRVGKDEKGIDYNGHSCVIDPKGNTLLDMGEKEAIQSISLSYEELMSFREKFPVGLDAD